MYAVILTGGKQYKVKPGQTLKVEKLDLDEGAKIDLDKVLLTIDGDDVQIGTPYLNKAKVSIEVLSHARDKKIEIIKFKRRKHHIKRMGHRQYFTTIKILDIQAA